MSRFSAHSAISTHDKKCSKCGRGSPTEVDFDHRILFCERCAKSRGHPHEHCHIKRIDTSLSPHKLRVVTYIVKGPGDPHHHRDPGRYRHFDADMPRPVVMHGDGLSKREKESAPRLHA
jgi:hypothetical protein